MLRKGDVLRVVERGLCEFVEPTVEVGADTVEAIWEGGECLSIEEDMGRRGLKSKQRF